MNDKSFSEQLLDCKENIAKHISIKKEQFEVYNMTKATHIVVPFFMRNLFCEDSVNLDFSKDKILDLKVLWSMDCGYEITVLKLLG